MNNYCCVCCYLCLRAYAVDKVSNNQRKFCEGVGLARSWCVFQLLKVGVYRASARYPFEGNGNFEIISCVDV